MMDEPEIRRLLAMAMAFDNRKPGQANVDAWQTAAAIGRWTFAEAAHAIEQHYAYSTDFLMPGHITEAIRAARQVPAPLILEPPRDPAKPERVRDVMREVYRRKGWGERIDQHHPALAYRCPHCGAAVDRPCARQVGRGHRRGQWVEITGLHPSRIKLTEENP